MAVAGPDEGAAWVHACRNIPERGITIQRTSELRDDDSVGWVLDIYREATEEDLEENHNLEEVGQLVWATLVEIRHCPFCGEKLTQAESQVPASAAQHYDYSGWSVEKS